MTGLHDAPGTREPRRSKRLQRSIPEAATPPPARRTRRTKRPAPPGEAEPSVPAARAARSSSPCCGDRELVDVGALPPPPAPRAEAPVRPPEREDSPDSPRTAYVLRSRRVPDTGNPKPTPPPCYEKREIKQDKPRLSKKQLKQQELWKAPACACKGLERYNSINEGDEHELVEAMGVKSFPYIGARLHAYFLARRKGASSSGDLVPKYFFAELKIDAGGLSCVSCIKFDSVNWKNFGGCGVCPATFVHPAGGGYIGARPERHLQHAPTGLRLSFSF